VRVTLVKGSVQTEQSIDSDIFGDTNLYLKTNQFFYYIMIKVTHSCGFFSCCSVKLHYIIEYFNKEKKLPDYVDSSEQFLIYKPIYLLYDDITYHFFKHENTENIEYINKIDFDWNAPLRPYKELDIDRLKPFINKYFTPSDEIVEISEYLETKYNLDYNNICAVYYRGTDQYKEIPYDDMNKFIDKMRDIKDVTYLVQSDDQNFINLVKENFSSNIIIIEENFISSTNKGIHNEFDGDNNYMMIKYFFATLLLIGKCKYIISSPISNGTLWCILYRGNIDNLIC
jgi:hypothetical protein